MAIAPGEAKAVVEVLLAPRLEVSCAGTTKRALVSSRQTREAMTCSATSLSFKVAARDLARARRSDLTPSTISRKAKCAPSTSPPTALLQLEVAEAAAEVAKLVRRLDRLPTGMKRRDLVSLSQTMAVRMSSSTKASCEVVLRA